MDLIWYAMAYEKLTYLWQPNLSTNLREENICVDFVYKEINMTEIYARIHV